MRARSPFCFTTVRSAVSPMSLAKSMRVPAAISGANGCNAAMGMPRASMVAETAAGSRMNFPSPSNGAPIATSTLTVASELPATRATMSAFSAMSPCADFDASMRSVLQESSPAAVGQESLLAPISAFPVVLATSSPPVSLKASVASASIESSPSRPAARVAASMAIVATLPASVISPPMSFSAYTAPSGPVAVKSMSASSTRSLRVPSGDALDESDALLAAVAGLSVDDVPVPSAGFASWARPMRPSASNAVSALPPIFSVTSLPLARARSPCATSSETSTLPTPAPPSTASPSTRCGENHAR